MSDVNSIKHSLLNAPWLEYSRVTVPGAEGPVELSIRRPPDSVLKELLKGVKDIQAEGQVEERAEGGLGFRARVVATCVFLPGAVRALFTEEEAHRWGGISLVFEECAAAINPGKALEKARGN